jgi:hypothetical protein
MKDVCSVDMMFGVENTAVFVWDQDSMEARLEGTVAST